MQDEAADYPEGRKQLAALRTVGVNIQSISDCVAGDRYRLIKLYGSVNWGQRVDVEGPYPLPKKETGVSSTRSLMGPTH